LSAVGAALGASENATKMRVNRALERLRSFFALRGVTQELLRLFQRFRRKRPSPWISTVRSTKAFSLKMGPWA